ncbi:MAG TPA: trehalase family glycosidase [Solirubrobacteraceae bacterium]|nr:trehalase family glycosidase [Solirubrobacteraceae bacterium]
MTGSPSSGHPVTPLADAARAILAANWTGRSTVPSRTLYPHQWSWDAAFNAIGWSHVDPARAAQELESLLGAQWDDGRIPHIAFHAGVPEEAYFPGPAFWRHGATSGITQPPVHPVAALEVARRGAGPAFLERVYPRLAAQHDYLARSRDARGAGLAAIVHPWESGLDNAPAWDEPLAAVDASGVSPYRRRDLDHADPADRPSDAAYDRYVLLAERYRERGYEDGDLRAWSPFLVEDPLFNALYLAGAHALAEIAARVGADPAPHRAAAERIHAALVDRLWDEEHGRFAPYDLVAERFVDRRSIVSLAPLLDPDLPAERVDRLASELASEHFWDPDGAGVTSYDRLAGDFEPRRYWRGPAWANTNWLLARGLRAHGRGDLAARLDEATLWLVERGGFCEYFDARTGEGHGSRDFSWTAALVLDILER